MEAIPSLLQGRRACEAGRRGPSVVNPLLMPASNFMGLIVIGSGSFSKAGPSCSPPRTVRPGSRGGMVRVSSSVQKRLPLFPLTTHNHLGVCLAQADPLFGIVLGLAL